MDGQMSFICLVIVLAAFLPETSSKRAKRDVDLEAGFCVIQCVGEYYNHSTFAGKADDAGSPICRHIELPEIDGICSMYNQGKDCVKKDCAGKPLAEMLLRVASYGCDQHYEEFKKFTPCFSENCGLIENTCKTKCGSLSDAAKYTSEQKEKLDQIRRISKMRRGENAGEESPSSINSDEDETGFEEFDFLRNFNLEGVCRYTQCYVNCTQTPLTNKCGAENYKFFKQVALDLIPMFFHGLFPNMTTPPQSCQTVLDMAKEGAPAADASKSGTPASRISNWAVTLASVCVTLIAIIALERGNNF